jgi:hypothetical protein
MDSNSASTQSFLVLAATVSFALFAASRAIETLKLFNGRKEDYRYLHSIASLSAVIMVASVLPLALSEFKNNIEICSIIFSASALMLFVYILYELLTDKIRLLFKQTSLVLFAASAIFILMTLANAFWYKSVVIYKMAVLWSIALLCIRFYLIMEVVVSKIDAE